MSQILEARYYRDPADVAEVNELKANHQATKERERLMKKLEEQRERQQLLDSIFKKARR